MSSTSEIILGDPRSHIHRFRSFSGPELIVIKAKYPLPSRRIDTFRPIKGILSDFINYNCPQLGHNPPWLLEWVGGDTVIRKSYNRNDFPKLEKMLAHAIRKHDFRFPPGITHVLPVLVLPDRATIAAAQQIANRGSSGRGPPPHGPHLLTLLLFKI